jgi:hypothetical protein
MLFGVVRRTLEMPRLRPWAGDDATGLALTISLVWMVHPLLTESVNYLSQRSELLMGVCVLLMLYGAIRSVGSRAPGLWEVVAIAACALGMASKEVMVIAPLLVPVYDRTVLGLPLRQAIGQRGRLYACLTATWLILAGLVAVYHPGQATHVVAGNLDAWRYATTQSAVIVHYLWLTIWPSGLVIDYADWPLAQRLAEVAPQATGLAALLIATAWGMWRHPPGGFSERGSFCSWRPVQASFRFSPRSQRSGECICPCVRLWPSWCLGDGR